MASPGPDWPLIRRLVRALEASPGGAMRRIDLPGLLHLGEYRLAQTVIWPAYARKLIDFCGRDWVVLPARRR